MSWEYDDFYPRAESVDERKNRAEKLRERLAKECDRPLDPAISKGTKIASTFWGQAWNKNLERYQHYDNRLPRGRSYVRNGLVLDLQIETGMVHAKVSGSYLYEIEITVKPLKQSLWKALKDECAGKIESMVGLLQGKLPPSVMEAVTREGTGLFPEPREIRFSCSCPDYSDLCKHSAAAAYGVGARLDEHPELLFLLRGVEPQELIENVGISMETPALDSVDELSAIFGIDLETFSEPNVEKAAPKSAQPKKKKKIK